MKDESIPAATQAPIAWAERKYFGALDWARDHHDLVVVDHQGTIVCELRFEHTPEGWRLLRERLAGFTALAVAVETNQGLAVEQLLESGYAVYPVNPKSAKRYRERKAPTGVKDDRRDAWSLADALRVDGHGWSALVPDDPLVAELRLLTRDEVALIGQRTALVNQLQSALVAYYPAAVAAFDDWTRPGAWTFVETFPTPAALTKAGPRKWEKFLHANQLWREGSSERRLKAFAAAEALAGAPGTTAAKSLLAVSPSPACCTPCKPSWRLPRAHRATLHRTPRSRPVWFAARRRRQVGPTAARRDRRSARTLHQRRRLAGLRGHRSGDLPIRPDRTASGAARLPPDAALRGTSLGRPLARLLRLGRRVLSDSPRTRSKPRLRPALSRPALAKDPLENVANPHSLRRGPPPP